MLDEAQKKVVEHRNGGLIVHAGPGSGKTRTLAARVVSLIEQGEASDKIMVITFTAAAAAEIRGRIETAAPGSGVWVSTIHALGRMMLLESLGKECPTLINERQAADRFFEACDREGLRATDDDRLYVEGLKSQVIPYGRSECPHYKAYVDLLSEKNEMDFQDLVFFPVLLWKTDTTFRRRWKNLWAHVMVDEAHDCTPAEATLARVISNDKLCLIMDENQSIYKWRQGSPTSLATVPVAHRFQLRYTYRCPSLIYEKAWHLIRKHTTQKRLLCARQGGAYESVQGPANDVLPNILRGMPDSMVLCRTQHEVQEVAEMLKGSHIPVNRLQTEFDTPEADMVLAYAAVASGRKAAWSRILSQVPEAKAVPTGQTRLDFERLMGPWTKDLTDDALARVDMVLEHFGKSPGALYGLIKARQVPKDNVRVMTMHAAKGLEADHVILYNTGRPAHRKQDNDAERCLLYVAITRARRSLFVHRNREDAPNRLLREIE